MQNAKDRLGGSALRATDSRRKIIIYPGCTCAGRIVNTSDSSLHFTPIALSLNITGLTPRGGVARSSNPRRCHCSRSAAFTLINIIVNARTSTIRQEFARRAVNPRERNASLSSICVHKMCRVCQPKTLRLKLRGTVLPSRETSLVAKLFNLDPPTSRVIRVFGSV